MQQELRLATFNVCNLALPGMKYYEDQEPYTAEQYEIKTAWIAQQLDRLDADVIGFQEIFSQAALRDVLAKTQKYRQACQLGFDSDPLAPPKPGLALVSRLPPVGNASTHSILPHDLSVALPGAAQMLTTFTRPILHAEFALSPRRNVDVYICHLKSRLPDYCNDKGESDACQHGVAILRSLIRRATDALGLRCLLSERMKDRHAPIVVMGDFNDIAGAVSSQLVMGSVQNNGRGLSERLFDCYRIQSIRDPLRDVGYTHVHEAQHETVDHVLVSEEFNALAEAAIGEVSEVVYLNDHLALKPPGSSDHGQVLVRIRLFDENSKNESFELPPGI